MTTKAEVHPGLLRAETVGLTLAALAAGKMAVGAASEMYHGARRARYSDKQFEAATAPSSIVPYIGECLAVAEDFGFEVVLAGGIAKKALMDPKTTFDIHNKIIKVSDDEDCLARKNATVVRPDEVTERDIDLFVKHIWIGKGENRKRIVADQSNPKVSKIIEHRRKQLQKRIDEFARERGLDIGPEISLFAYDEPFGHDFRFLDYATKTELHEKDKKMYEVQYDNIGNTYEIPVDKQWTLDIGGLSVPVNSPQVQLGRTLTRTMVPRDRDIKEVNKAIKNLKGKGLWQGEMVNIWSYYQNFRHAMNQTLHVRNLAKSRGLKGLNLVGLRLLAPLSGTVEDSDLMSGAIRDRRGPFAKIAANIMNASNIDSSEISLEELEESLLVELTAA